MEPITLGIAAAVGVVYRAARDRTPEAKLARQRRKDRRRDRVLPASWEQWAEIDGLASVVAHRDDRASDHVLREYGAFTYAAGRTRTMVRKDLTRREAERVIRRLRKYERVTLDPDRARFERERDPLEPREDEEPF